MLHVISEHGNQNSENTKLLAALALGTVKHLGGETAVIDADNNVLTGWRLARIGDFALLAKPADRQSPKRIDCYHVVEEENFGDGKRAKLDPARMLFSLRHVHNATPPDFQLLLFDEPCLWFHAVVTALLGELNRHDPGLSAKPPRR